MGRAEGESQTLGEPPVHTGVHIALRAAGAVDAQRATRGIGA